MAEQVFSSAGIKAREIDLTGPKATVATGIPAGVIGTSGKGPAFVPIKVANFSEFAVKFGDTDGKKFGPLAIRAWFDNGAGSGTFMRVLGAGDCQQRNADGSVTSAGFVAGQRLVQGDADGDIGDNSYSPTPTATTGIEGRTFLFGCYMSESSPTSTVLREAGLTEGTTGNGFELVNVLTQSVPILRGVLMTPSGVIAALSCSDNENNAPLITTPAARHSAGGSIFGATYTTASFGPTATDCGGGWVGDVSKTANTNGQFVMLLNGHTPNESYGAIITASFDMNSSAYFPNVFNTDPLKVEEAGHYLYAHWGIHPQFATITGSHSSLSGSAGYPQHAAGTPFWQRGKRPGQQIAFMVTASIGRNSGSLADISETTDAYGIPNFDGFDDRYQAAFSPYVTSQDMGEGAVSLFRFVALSDGVGGYTPTTLDLPPERMKISIYNIKKSTSTKPGAAQYGTFDVAIRDLWDNDKNIRVYEKFTNCNLNPASENYIARRIGDQRMYFDFDRALGSQKLQLEGRFPNKSNLVRVEMNPVVDQGPLGIDEGALPVGFRGLFHLITSGTGVISAVSGAVGTDTGLGADAYQAVDKLSCMSSISQPPVPFRRSMAINRGGTTVASSDYYWGIQTTKQESLSFPNSTLAHDDQIDSWTKYFPMFRVANSRPVWVGNNAGAADRAGTVVDSDRFCNNRFTLERVQVVTQSVAIDLPNATEWQAAQYRRNGTLADLTKSDGTTQPGRFLDVTKDFGDSTTRKYLKFTLMMQGGFDGLNIFGTQKFKMSDIAVRREFDNVATQGGLNGPTLAAYRKAIDVMAEKAYDDIQLLAIPGLRHRSITNYALDAIENRFDAFYLMDIEEKDSDDLFITSSVTQLVDVTTTARNFGGRNLDSSFAAAYFPDLTMVDNGTSTIVKVPPTVAVLGAFALNDSVAYPWYAPAGFTRGALRNVENLAVQLNQKNLDDLYSTDINPIASFPATGGPKVFGQKTLLSAQSALDRVNVRRLLIEVRRRVRAVGQTILFEPNREETLAKFSAAVNPILKQIQQQQGVVKFKVQIDTTTTTQTDIENNTLRGKIFLQPTKAVEFIALDFVLTNAIDPDSL